MKKQLLFTIKQCFKMLLQNLILPFAYSFWRMIYHNREPDLIIFADSHHDKLPFSMELIHAALESKGYLLTDEIYNFSSLSQFRSTVLSLRFMRLYAKAKYVFICDNFLPVSSCRKCKKTKVVQLWHCCGLMKKMGYDTFEDIPKNYHGKVFNNYDLVTVSSPACEIQIENAMRLPSGIVQALGVSRTDVYFDINWIEACKKEFFSKYPNAQKKKIILWAPTFRGNAGIPYQVGIEEIEQLKKQLGNEYHLIRKVHPHIEQKYHLSDCNIPTERLLPVVDLLISDYSTILFEFLFFDKPYVLFAPDLKEYERNRGFYIDYFSLSPYLATDLEQLKNVVLNALLQPNGEWVCKQKEFHISSCDGKSTERILKSIGL